MICDGLKFIFIDICKTAGTSIIVVLLTYARQHGHECIGKHHSITNIVGNYAYCTNLTKQQIEDYFKFTIVRNPWDRLVSLWFWGVKTEYQCSFKEFVYNVRDKVYKDNNYSRYIPMLDWITNEEGEVQVDFIARYENLENDFAIICEKIGIPKLSTISINTAMDRSGSPRKHYSYYYDDELKNIVANLYKKDIEFFDYIFEDSTE